MARRERNPASFREYAGVLTAFIVVQAFVAIGYVQIAVVLYRGVAITIPGDWMAAMLSLASTALGFLIGKQLTGVAADAPPTPPTVNASPDATITVSPAPGAPQ